MLAARRGLILAILIAVVLGTAILLVFTPRSWTASTDVLVEYRDSDPISGRSLSALLDDSYLQTQTDLLRSQRVASQAIELIGWRDTADYADAVERDGRTATDARLLAQVTRNTTVSAARGSRVLSIAYEADSPQAARDVANAIVAAYLSITRDMALSAARSRSEQYTVQIEELRREADAVQDALTRYVRDNQIVATTDDNDVDMRRLQALNALRVEVGNRLEGAQANVERIQALSREGLSAQQLPEIAQLPTLQALKDKLSDVERRRSESAGRLGPQHPTMRGLAAERADLNARLASEARSALAGIGLEAERLRAQEARLAQDVGELQTRILEQRAHRDRIAAYRRQLLSVEQVYNAALQKYDGLLMASHIVQANLTVLRAAELPTEPSAPRVTASLLASVFVGLLLGLGVALMLELAVRRVRCADDVRSATRLPLLGQVGEHVTPQARGAAS